jgi:DNA polymerase-3 subunit delta'
MSDDLLLHPLTEKRIREVIDKPPHALLITGVSGIGKSLIAQKIAMDVLGIKTDTIDPKKYKLISSDTQSISIEDVRTMEHFLSLRVPGKRAINRVIVILDSQKLTPEAQNALLKTLEEPPIGTLLLLTARHQSELIDTIQSRTQIFDVNKPSNVQLEDFFVKLGYDTKEIHKALAMSGGLPGLMRALLSNDDHPIREAALFARKLLTSTRFERLREVEVLVKKKELTLDMLDVIRQMANLSLKNAQQSKIDYWRQVLEADDFARYAILRNAQLKLTLSDFVMKL